MKLVRVSKDEQSDTSPEDQGKVLDEFAIKHGMVHAGDDIVLNGVTGSVPAARTDIEGIISRKLEHDDFEVLLIQDSTRFTRVGIEHGNSLKWDLAKVGIEVIFVTFGSTGDADSDGMLQTMSFYSGQQQAKSISYASTRGRKSSMAAGTVPHTQSVPYGIDRVYIGNDGTPRHRIRNLADGRQQMLHPTDEVVLRTFERNPEKGASTHYIRQSDERIEFVAGAPERVEVVRRIFRQKLLHGDGAYRISKMLNNEGILSSTGKLWCKDSIDSVLENAVYTGIGISGRYDTGLYHRFGKQSAPEPVDRQLTTIARRKKSQKKYRRREDWNLLDYPVLANYLGDLHELAVAMQEREFEKQDKLAAGPQPKQKPGGDRHVESAFVLKDVLRSVQGNHPMTGRRAGSPKKPIRYYAVSRGASAPKDGSPLGRMIPAEPLERAVMAVVKEVLRDVPNVKKEITALVEADRKARDADQQQLQPLLDEQARLQEQLADAMALGPSLKRLMKDKFDRWETESVALDERIAKARQFVATEHIDPTAAVNAISRRFKQWADSMDGLPPSGIRKVLANVVSKLEVDLETRHVRMELSLPDGITLSAKPDAKVAKYGEDPMCLVKNGRSLSFDQAHRLALLRIGVFDCMGEPGRKNVPWCFTCRRRAA